ncbi:MULTISPECIES: class F sortase [unclassified Streptomyces]|uniref:class F sortase n=1 Tax=unclassified Streptomyces TaxID=2593676 RepID=UPI0022582DC4|nr:MULTISPECIES: class F sortase [unclassified Streptomyces]MCX5335797.1 class F sortase [Streptomyces sp. NBC_00140]MCX5366513.1 class F sortase [Streptomyces sp. NBC_00124]
MAVPPSPADNPSRTKVMVIGAVAALVLAISLFGGNDTASDTASSDAPRPSRPAHTAAAAPPAAQPAAKHLPRSRPVRLLIPKISVDAPFTELAIGRTGQLEPPPADDTNLVGWHAKGASPGEAGTSIIAGHVDTATSAAVFADLGELEKGDVFHVRRADGRKASFVVDSVETFDKENFPSRRVYADTGQAQVRLITCAGDYDRTVRDYTDNLVVFAHLV